MQPTIALVLCSIFVLVLLRLDRKQSPEVSHALWIPTIWMLLISSKPLGIWFGGAGADEEGSSLDRVFLTVLLCLGVLVLAKRKLGFVDAIKENPWLMLLIGYMLVSISWSDMPFTSFKRWVKEFTAVVMALAVATELCPRKAMESLLRRTIYILVPFSLLLIKYFPAYGREYGRWSGALMWIGVTMQKNGLGRLCPISVMFLVWSLIGRWVQPKIPAAKFLNYAELIVLFTAVYLMNAPGGAYSATGIVALAVGLFAYAAFLWAKRRGGSLARLPLRLLFCSVMFFGTATVFAGGSTVGSFTSTVGRDNTLTGRTEVWAQLLPVAMEKPILGWGFGGFWTPGTRDEFDISEAHSGYLEMLLSIGFVGLLVFVMFVVSSCRKARSEFSYDFQWASLWVCLFLMTLVHNITESSLHTFNTQLTAIVLFLPVSSKGAISGPVETESKVTSSAA